MALSLCLNLHLSIPVHDEHVGSSSSSFRQTESVSRDESGEVIAEGTFVSGHQRHKQAFSAVFSSKSRPVGSDELDSERNLAVMGSKIR